MPIAKLASQALEHSDHVEQLVRWALLQVVHVENERAGRIQDCLSHLCMMQENLKSLVSLTKEGKAL